MADQITVRVQPIPSTNRLNIFVPSRALPEEDDGAEDFWFDDLDEALEALGKAGWEQLNVSIKNGDNTLLFFKKVEKPAIHTSWTEDL